MKTCRGLALRATGGRHKRIGASNCRQGKREDAVFHHSGYDYLSHDYNKMVECCTVS